MNIEKDTDRKAASRRVTVVGGIFNVLLSLIKGGVGLWAGSTALLSEAVHSLSDLVGDGVVFVGVWLGGSKVDEAHPYGRGKYEALATLGVAFMLFLAGFGLAWDAIVQILAIHDGNPEALKPIPMTALWVILGAAIIKEILYHWSRGWARRLNSLMLKAYSIHHRIDALASLAVGIGVAGAIFLGPRARILDPITALIVAFFIFAQGVSVAKGALVQLLDRSMARDELEYIRSCVNEIGEFRDIHALRARRIGNVVSIAMHVKVDGSLSVQDVDGLINRLETLLARRYGEDLIVTIQVEPMDREVEAASETVENLGVL